MKWIKKLINLPAIPEIQGVSIVVYDNNTRYIHYPLTEIEINDIVRDLKKRGNWYIITRTNYDFDKTNS